MRTNYRRRNGLSVASAHRTTGTKGIDMAITTGIVGAAGFAGIELTRLALRHPDLDLRVVTSNELAGTPVAAEYPGFTGATDLAFATHDDPALDACDLVFLAVPHTAALKMAPQLVARGVTVVDLSADFRLKDPAVYERWYATPHTATDLLQRAAFGLPELFPDDLARVAAAHAAGEGVLVACAGCYPTATSLAAAPAVRAGLVRPTPSWWSTPSPASRARARRPRRALISASPTRTSKRTAWPRTATRPRSSRSWAWKAASCSRRISRRSIAVCCPP